MSIVVSHLSKHFGEQKAVDNISFEAKPGQILGFLGPNGAGKTTTMKMICGYLEPTYGSAQVCGFDISAHSLNVRKKIGYLPEHNPLYEEMYVMEYLAFVASIHRIQDKQKRISEVVEMTGLTKEMNKIIGTLSKGYRQRVGLAQAILHDPEVLILDEPTSGLDMNQLADIRQLIRTLGKEKTVIFSSHVMQEVQSLCDRVIIINNGVLVADDPIEKLQNRMAGNQMVNVVFAEVKINEQPFRQIPGLISIEKNGDVYEFQSEMKSDIRPEIFRTAVSQGLTIIEMVKVQQNIESIFRQLTGKTADV
ncbi:MAG: ATP-binding cassette domain-containing protein [Saprospiraceae bacterium]|nr:ATP-binding cassette domain-containing protein [Saprospiraceae bacterium]